jgi:hypothetical protein
MSVAPKEARALYCLPRSPAPFCEGWDTAALEPVLSNPKDRPLRFAVLTLRQKAQARRHETPMEKLAGAKCLRENYSLKLSPVGTD